jgi:metallo-beta-lactamase family protein
MPILRDPVLPIDADTLIMECTYGDKDHGDPLQAIDELRQLLMTTFARGGKVIIPAFAVGRTQEIVYDIHQMIERSEIPQVPVYVDSPLAVEASEIFIQHPELYDNEVRNFTNTAESRTALGFDLLTYVQSIEESKAIDEQDEPMVIISASGMLETGRVVHHVRHAIEDPRNTILIVSYQAPDTPGRALANGEKEVRILGKVYERRADVAQIGGLSGHAGQSFLLEYAEAVKGKAKQIFLVHGEDRPAEILRGKLQEAGLEKIYYPYLRQSMEVE